MATKTTKRLFRAAVRSNPQLVYRAGAEGASLIVWVNSQTLEGDRSEQILISDDRREFEGDWVGVPVPFNSPVPVTLDPAGELFAATPGIAGVDVHLNVSVVTGAGVEEES